MKTVLCVHMIKAFNMEKKSAAIEKYKKYINMHKRQMKIANKMASIKP